MLKSGFTTGSCAAAAAKAAAMMAADGKKVHNVSIMTPSGTEFRTVVERAEVKNGQALCAVKKYAGDDPDVTDGILIFAEVTLTDEEGIFIDSGKGVGRVTKKGLGIDIGEAAINRVPRLMIEKEVSAVLKQKGLKGAKVIISAEGGEEIAQRTFNPRLGIEGGISILGTSGIVQPMSRKALMDAIKAEMRVKRENEGNILLITPGNYGAEFIKDHYKTDMDKALKCSNFIGETVETAVEYGFEKILLIGHLGKLVKLAGGIGDTHSKNADCRMEILAANSALCTDDIKAVRETALCNTTEEAVNVLKKYGILHNVMEMIVKKAGAYLTRLTEGRAEIGIIMFTNEMGVLAETANARSILEKIKDDRIDGIYNRSGLLG